MVADVEADVAVAVLLLAMFVVVGAEVAFPAEVATAAAEEEEASVADQAVMAAALLLMEVVLLPTAVGEATAAATVTRVVPPTGHPLGGKFGAIDITGSHSIHLRHPFLFHLIRLHDGACKYNRRMLQARRRQFPLADTTRHHTCNFLILGTAC